MTMTAIENKTSAELLASKGLAAGMKRELTDNILPYWMDKMCRADGRFHGRISGGETLDAEAPVGGIMTARILWTFASAYRVLGSPEYLEMALKAKDILIRCFYDPEFGGTYWSLNPDYTPLDTKKQIYAIAFTIYGLAELNRATGDAEALEYAIKLFHAIEVLSPITTLIWDLFSKKSAQIISVSRMQTANFPYSLPLSEDGGELIPLLTVRKKSTLLQTTEKIIFSANANGETKSSTSPCSVN